MEVSEEYVKGFNNGYLIRKNHPVLAKTLLNGASGHQSIWMDSKLAAKSAKRNGLKTWKK